MQGLRTPTRALTPMPVVMGTRGKAPAPEKSCARARPELPELAEQPGPARPRPVEFRPLEV